MRKFIGYVLLTVGNVLFCFACADTIVSSEFFASVSKLESIALTGIAIRFVVAIAFLVKGGWLIRPLPLLSESGSGGSKHDRKIARRRLRNGLVCKILGGQIALWGLIWLVFLDLPSAWDFLADFRPMGFALLLVGAGMVVLSWFWFREFSVTDLQASYTESARVRSTPFSWGSRRSKQSKGKQAEGVSPAWSSGVDDSSSEGSEVVEYYTKQTDSPIEEYPPSSFWQRD